MRTSLGWKRSLLVVALGACSSACSSASSSSNAEDVGEVSAAISSVPQNVACIDLQVSNGQRIVDRTFPVTPGQASANLSVTGLPLGNDVLNGLAYAVTCSSVTSTTSADWATDPVAVTLTPGKTGNVSLQFHAAGSLTIGVGFDDAGVAAWLAASPASAFFTSSTGACGAPVAAQSFTLTNQGSGPTKPLSVTFAATRGNGVFGVVSGSDKCTGKTLAAGASCTVSVGLTGGCGDPAATMSVGDGTTTAAVSLTGSIG